MQFTLSCIVFILWSPTFALYPNPYGNPTGSVALYSDSTCLTNAYANNWTLGGDFCAVLHPQTSSSNLVSPPVLGSYLIDLRPTCDNGSYADWATYWDVGCSEEKTRVPNNNDDTCESLAGVLAVAFICNGFVASGTAATSSKPLLQTILTIAEATTSIESFGITSRPTISSTSKVAVITGTTNVVLSNSVSTPGTSTSGTNSSAPLSSPSAIRTGAASRLENKLAFVASLLQTCLLLAGA
ncbi:hypothetical protein N431DRAFT_425520 [Stipitochalara longipes BDJ]|nr:hypothetical protein N431DRAFT_425520 [Stipitochalara longipes BDJ]